MPEPARSVVGANEVHRRSDGLDEVLDGSAPKSLSSLGLLQQSSIRFMSGDSSKIIEAPRFRR